MNKILVTGAAGFIGSHVVQKLIELNYNIIGLDSISDYYDINLKYSRLCNQGISCLNLSENKKISSSLYSNYCFIKTDISNFDFIVDFMAIEKFDFVINLAAQAGVRYSLSNPESYITSNISGFLNILEGAQRSAVKHLIYASSSSVYGLNSNYPFSESSPTEHPISLYAASKKSNEMMAHAFSHIYSLPTTGLRFFTVYGPWGRPDMAIHLFTKSILEGKPIHVFNNGNLSRDFTYIDDVVESVTRLITKPAKGSKNWDGSNPISSSSSAPYQLFNVGNSNPIKLMDYILELEKAIGIKANLVLMPMQLGDVNSTHANIELLASYINYKPLTLINEGVPKFVDWFKSYYKISK
jgi:UDP-glucuronate 4-epimerase